MGRKVTSGEFGGTRGGMEAWGVGALGGRTGGSRDEHGEVISEYLRAARWKCEGEGSFKMLFKVGCRDGDYEGFTAESSELIFEPEVKKDTG